jgi:RNA polymerase subunit RPABC4/transcription elongation factor Spt4
MVDSWQGGVTLAVVAVVAYLVVMWIGALVWVYRDISARTRDPVTQTISILILVIFNLPGLLLYLILRPKDTLAERYDRQLEAEALMQELQDQPACPACRRRSEPDFLMCPYCRAALREPCSECGRALAFGWVACPYCGATRGQPAPKPAAPRLAPVDAEAGSAASPQRERRRPPSTATFTPPARPPQSGADAARDAPGT